MRTCVTKVELCHIPWHSGPPLNKNFTPSENKLEDKEVAMEVINIKKQVQQNK